MQRLAWAYLSPSSRALTTSLMGDISTDVQTLGSKVTLADAIVLDAILGTAKAAGVLVKLGGWQGIDATADCAKALARIVAKTVKDVGKVSRFEGCDIKEYLETGLHDRREGPKRLSRAKPRGTFDLPNRINAGTLTQRAVFFCPMDRCSHCRTADAGGPLP